MTSKKWKELIVSQCVSVGTYNDSFGSVIDTLADILEQRDQIWSQFKKEGRKTIVQYTNKGGATNSVKNPLLVQWDDLNKTALAFWKELGLTAQSLRKVSDGGIQTNETMSALEKALASIGI